MQLTRHYRQLASYLLVLVCLLSTHSSQALTAQPYTTHGVSQQDSNTYIVDGEDPYFVMPLPNTSPVEGSGKLSLGITIQRPAEHEDAISAELFFKLIRIDAVPIFDPLYKIQFQLPTTEFSKIVIPLPNSIELQAGQLLRMDIDSCLDCIITLDSGFSMTTIDADVPNQVIIDNFLNGIQSLSEQGQFISSFTAFQDWRLHHFEPEGEKLIISDEDPFWVSPPLHIDTSNFSGILVDLEVPAYQPSIYDFQLFYSTEEHRFIEKASSVIRVVGKSTKQGDHNQLQFFVPLDFLSEQFPPVRVLKHIRLDLVRYPDDRIESDTWSLPKIKLVHKTESIDLSELSTTRIVHAKRQHAAFNAVVMQIFKKLGNDPGFLIAYVFLFIVLIAFAVIRYRGISNSKPD